MLLHFIDMLSPLSRYVLICVDSMEYGVFITTLVPLASLSLSACGDRLVYDSLN